MRVTSHAFLWVLCVNVFISMVYIAQAYPTLGLNPGTQIDPQINQTIHSWTGSTSFSYGDPLAALSFFWGIFQRLILGFPTLISQLGAPLAISWGVGLIWSVIWVTKIYEVIRGGTFFD